MNFKQYDFKISLKCGVGGYDYRYCHPIVDGNSITLDFAKFQTNISDFNCKFGSVNQLMYMILQKER